MVSSPIAAKESGLAAGSAPASSSSREFHVVHVIGQLFRGGAELQLARLLDHLRAPWRHSVLQFLDGGDEEILRAIDATACARVELHKRRRFDPAFILRLIRSLRDSKPDIVHLWLASAALWGGILARPSTRRQPVITSIRGEPMYKVPGALFMERFAARRVNAHIFNGRGLAENCRARLGLAPSSVFTVPNGVDDARFRPRPKDAALRTALGCPREAVLVTMVGSLYPVKNWPMFLEIARQVRNAGRKAFFLGVGGGGLLEGMRCEAATMGLSEMVSFTGRRTDVPEISGESDIALFTSNSEGMPNAVLEAMACGLPVVSTRVSGADELVAEGINGYLVPTGDAVAAAECLIRLCDDAALRARMGAESRKRIHSYTFAAMAAGHDAVYRKVLADYGRTIPSRSEI